MLQISHLYADYGGKPALEDINLTLESGELLVVLGPSGCGKTTLLNLIAGLCLISMAAFNWRVRVFRTGSRAWRSFSE